MFFSDFKFDDWLLFHFDELLILFTFFLSSNWCLASHGKSYRGPKRYLDFLIFILTVFIWTSMSFANFKFDDWLTLMNCWFCLLFFLSFKLMFGKPWKKLSRPKKVFWLFDFHFNSVHINYHVLFKFYEWLLFLFDELLILFTFFLSSNLAIAYFFTFINPW
jgi:hypothetical protein